MKDEDRVEGPQAAIGDEEQVRRNGRDPHRHHVLLSKGQQGRGCRSSPDNVD
jgi:hypothetical protein